MQSSNNKTKRTRKSAEESVAASLEAPAAQPEESAIPRPKRTAKKVADSAPAVANHRKATKKAEPTVPQTAPVTEPVAARPSAATGPFNAQDPVEPQIVTYESIAKLAYSYWEGRGYQGGCPVEDWLRAERELRLS